MADNSTNNLTEKATPENGDDFLLEDNTAGETKKIGYDNLKTALQNDLTIASAFTSLTDAPNSYVGQANRLVSVNVGETGLAFTAPPTVIADHTNLTSIGTNSHAQIDSHIESTSNPHSVTASQVGLGNVANADTTTTSNITDSLDKRFVTDAEKTILSNTSGTNTGDQDLSGLTPNTRSISTTAPLSGGGNLTADRTLSITQSTTSTDGFLSSTDWNTFNNKQAALGFTPENVANKAVDFSTLNNTLYPTTQAVDTALSAKLTDPMTTIGDIIIRNSGNTTARLGVGSNGQVLTVNSGVPSWQAAAGGLDINGLTPETIVRTGDELAIYDVSASANRKVTKGNLLQHDINTQASAYTLTLTDVSSLIEMNSGSAVNLTVPLNSSVAFPIGTRVDIVQYGAGQITIVPTGGVTIRSFASSLKSAGQYAGMSLYKRGTDEWVLTGNLA